MARRFGPEESRGLAGGSLVSAESLRYQKMADNLCAQGKPNEAAPFMLKAMEDKNNVDIFVTFAFVQQNYRKALEVLEDGKLIGESSLESKYGPDAFKDGGPLVGQFNEVMDTRPYMRLLQAMVRVAVECKNHRKAAETIIEMFRLNPMDPMQQHKWLPTLLCRIKRYPDTLYFCQVFLDIFVSRLSLSQLPPGGGTQFLPPRRELYTPQEQEKMASYESTISYGAALAAFRLSGDCEESRMYLRAAVKANPTVMLKILRRSERPRTLNASARSYNSPEDAHDYLWLSQDLWLEEDVWNWVHANSDAQQAVRKDCSRPGCRRGEQSPDCVFEQEAKAIRRAISKGQPIPASGSIPVFAADFSEEGVRGYDPAPIKMTPEQEREEAERRRKRKEKKKQMNKKKEERKKAKKREEKQKIDIEAARNDGSDLEDMQEQIADASLE
ncbi:hypothetical protein HHX47_DHR2000211 [Lentinula edodes]|nr:hypothetical protein HHX47_DHR2000211 [Lentinula edodes]